MADCGEYFMKYAPVLITTLCRFEHFKRCLESLADNELASGTEVYIALDYPANDSHQAGYQQICGFLDSFSRERFRDLHVIKRRENYGAIRNIQEAKWSLFKKYDRLIISEDDNEFSPNFLEYMDKALAQYENDPRVDSVCGYSYPLPWSVNESCSAFFCDSTFSTWGYGTWRDKAKKRESLIESGWLVSEFERSFQAGSISRMVRNRRDECIVYNGLEIDKELARQVCDFLNGIYLSYAGVCTVVPTCSKVRNWGFDGTGLYCDKIVRATGRNSQDYNYSAQPIDNRSYSLIVDERFSSETENSVLLDAFLYVPWRLRVKAGCALLIYRLLGVRGMRTAGRAYRVIRDMMKRPGGRK